MPTPNAGESQDDFLGRCIPIVMHEGTATDNSQAAAICHSLWEKHLGSHQALWVTVQEMRALCPSCADRMRAKGLERVNLYQMPEQLMQGLCAQFGSAEGFRTRCMDGISGVDDPAAFCNWLKGECGMMSARVFLVDEFVATQPGQAIRLFPFGTLIKDGKTRTIDRDLAAKFRLPHFKPPIKLGSHEEVTPAGGHILSLFVGEDGLYGLPEFTEKGAQALKDGAYRYHSPEVIWEDGWIEDPSTGSKVFGPLIVGDALLHTPHLGEGAALYTVKKGQDIMAEGTIPVPTPLWEKFLGWFNRNAEPPAAGDPPVPEAYQVALRERDQLKAQIKQMETQQAHAARVQKFEAEVAATKANREGLAELLAGMSDETAGRILQELKALSAQIVESTLTGEHGSAGTGLTGTATPTEAFNALVLAKAAELKVPYPQAFEIVKAGNADLFEAMADDHRPGRKEK